MAEHPDTPVVEMDTVEGVKGGKVILTLYFRNCGLQLYYIREHNDSQSVSDYEKILGVDVYKKLFPVILTDNSSELSNLFAIELTLFKSIGFSFSNVIHPPLFKKEVAKEIMNFSVIFSKKVVH